MLTYRFADTAYATVLLWVCDGGGGESYHAACAMAMCERVTLFCNYRAVSRSGIGTWGAVLDPGRPINAVRPYRLPIHALAILHMAPRSFSAVVAQQFALACLAEVASRPGSRVQDTESLLKCVGPTGDLVLRSCTQCQGGGGYVATLV